MSVIEAMMVLQVREIISNERVMHTVQRYGPNVHPRKLQISLPVVSEKNLEMFRFYHIRKKKKLAIACMSRFGITTITFFSRLFCCATSLKSVIENVNRKDTK